MRKPLKPRHSTQSNQGPENPTPIILVITPGPLSFVFVLPHVLQCHFEKYIYLGYPRGRGVVCLGFVWGFGFLRGGERKRREGRGALLGLNNSLASQLRKWVFRFFALVLCSCLVSKWFVAAERNCYTCKHWSSGEAPTLKINWTLKRGSKTLGTQEMCRGKADRSREYSDRYWWILLSTAMKKTPATQTDKNSTQTRGTHSFIDSSIISVQD